MVQRFKKKPSDVSDRLEAKAKDLTEGKKVAVFSKILEAMRTGGMSDTELENIMDDSELADADNKNTLETGDEIKLEQKMPPPSSIKDTSD